MTTQTIASDIEPGDRSETAGKAQLKRIPYHALSNTFPMMSKHELAELAADIAENGQHQPIIVYEGQILDGRNRQEACLLAGVTPLTEEYGGHDPVGFVISANLHRRHLTQAQKQDVVAKVLAEHPELSDRAIGKMTHVDHKTVGAKRAAMEGSGELPHVARRAGSKGRPYRADKKTSTRRSSIRLAIAPTIEDEGPDTDPVWAFADLLNDGDIKGHLNNLLRLLTGQVKKRIVALPKEHREALARRFLDLLEIHTDDLRPIEYVPPMEGAFLPGLSGDLQHDEKESGDAESASASEITSAKPTDTLH